MTIKEVIIGALRRIGREDIAQDMEDGGEPLGENAEVVSTLLYCVNATEDELARYYFPLKYTQTVTSHDNVFPFSQFHRTPVRILGVKSGGKDIKYGIYGNGIDSGISAEAEEIEVTYHYTPQKKELEDDSEYGCLSDGNITGLGAASEYCLLMGETGLAKMWEERYRDAIDRARSKWHWSAHIPPRRWI